MTRLYSNNFSTTLDGSITDVATSMTLTSVTDFPAVGSGDTCQVTIDDGTNIEIVQATAIAGSVVTIVRGQEGTSGTAFADDVTVEIRLTKLSLDFPNPSTQVAQAISQSSHGLSVGDVIRLSGSNTYTKAQSDDAANAEVVGVVTKVEDTDNFTYSSSGRVTGLSSLTANTVYFLDPSTAGATSATEPTSSGEISRPVYIADTTTSAILLPYRGVEVGPSPYITDIVEDTTPQLGGDLDVNSNQITSGGGGDIELHSDNDVNIILGDAAGADDFNIKDSASSIVASIDSDGAIQASSISFDSGTNVLDDYEEGTFTPTYEPTTGSFTSMSITSVGRYQRIGKWVTCSMELRTTAIDTTGGTGDVKITGLPFTAVNQTPGGGGASHLTQRFNLGTAAEGFALMIDANTSYCRIVIINSNSDIGYVDSTELLTTGGSFDNLFNCLITYRVEL